MSACTLKGLCPRICHELDQRLKALGGNIVDAKIFRVPLNHGGKVGDMFWYEENNEKCLVTLKYEY